MIQLKKEHRDGHRIYTLSSFIISLISLLFYFTESFGHSTGAWCSQGHKETMHDIKKSWEAESNKRSLRLTVKFDGSTGVPTGVAADLLVNEARLDTLYPDEAKLLSLRRDSLDSYKLLALLSLRLSHLFSVHPLTLARLTLGLEGKERLKSEVSSSSAIFCLSFANI